MPGAARLKRYTVWRTALKERSRITPERRKEMLRLQARRSMEGSQCFASRARKLLIGSEEAKVGDEEEKRRRVVIRVAMMR